MTFRVPFTVTNHTISFFGNGRMHSVSSSDQVAYSGLRAALMTPDDQDHVLDDLLSLVDVRHGLIRQSQGQIVMVNDDIIFQGKPLHNVWVEKILTYRAANEPYGPIWNALNKLVHNPTPQAIERLPIFLERTALGFLPDGRFLAFKGVKADFFSAHVGADGTKFRHLVGDVCRMERKDVDPDPNQTCSTGLHVGAPGYVKGNYSGARYALVLVAVDPVDVVCVPVDYSGEKMRVCGYEVIAHLDQDYNDELLGSLRTTQSHGYGAPVPPAAPVASDDNDPETGSGAWDEPEDEEGEEEDTFAWANGVAVGDVVNFHEHGTERYAVVTDIDGLNEIVVAFGPEGNSVDIVEDDLIDKIPASDVIGSMVAVIGDIVTIAGHASLRDGDYLIDDIDDSEDQGCGDDAFFCVKVTGFDENVAIANGLIQAVKRNDATFWPGTTVTVSNDSVTLTSNDGHDLRGEAETMVLTPGPLEYGEGARRPVVGERVVVDGAAWPPTGVYPVIEVFASGVIVQTEHDGKVSVNDWYIKSILSA